MRLFSQWKGDLNPDARTTIDQIRESYAEGRLIPFVGAGLSMCEAKFPSWGDFLKQLTATLNGKDREIFSDLSENHLEQSEFFYRKKGNRSLRYKVEEQLASAENELHSATPHGATFLPCQRRLVRRFNRVYTTNYDHLLELACAREGCDVASIFDAKSAESKRKDWCQVYPFSSPRAMSREPGDPPAARRIVQIVKFHGDYVAPETMVITESDYYRRLIDVDAKDIMLMADLLSRDILFLGYRFGDTDLKYTFHQLGRLMDEVEREFPDRRRPGRLFLVTTEENEARAEYLHAAYGVSSVCIQSLTTPKRKHAVTYAPNRKNLAKSKWSGSDILLANFGDLFALAQTEPTETARRINAKEFDALEKTAVRILHSRLSSRRRDVLKSIAETRRFRAIRAEVMRSCYQEFLNAMF